MRKARGFTLIELLIVIAIIAVLLTILIPALQAAKKQAKAVVCKTHLRAIGQAMLLYAQSNKQYIPRDETDGNWQMLFMPYVGGLSDDIEGFWEVKVFDCPSYPEKAQLVDYCMNAWDFSSGPDGKERRGASRLSTFSRPDDTIYLTDYEYHPTWNHIQIVTKEDARRAVEENNPNIIKLKLRWMDVYNVAHLPRSNVNRRVARERHKTGANCLFIAGHVEWMDSEKNQRYYWGGPWELNP